jgi:pyruvate dehydrogenase E1 component alpha subunit
LYRNKEEVEQWRKRDPILLLKEQLHSMGALDENRAAELEEKAEAEMEDAVAFAGQGTLEPVGDLTKDVTTPQ